MTKLEPVYVSPADEASGQFTVNYYGDPAAVGAGWKKDKDPEGRPRWYRTALFEDQSVAVGYAPRLPAKGRYRIEVYIPAQHAFARDVHYFVVDHTNGVRREVACILNQAPYSDRWAPLSGTSAEGGPLITEFELDPEQGDSGRINVADVTRVNDPKKPAGFEITFGAIRWVPLAAEAAAGAGAPATVPTGGQAGVITGGDSFDGKFHAPVGSEAARNNPIFAPANKLHIGKYQVWVDEWYDANPIGSRYELGPGKMAIHTGADLNRSGGQLADKQAPVYACADGIVRFSDNRTTWKGLVLVEHAVPGEAPVFIRYAHLEEMRFRPGDRVRRGEVVGLITLFYKKDAYENWHLHFDMSRNPVFATNPGHWPGDNPDQVRAFYIDPTEFIRSHH